MEYNLTIDQIIASDNVAELLDDTSLSYIGKKVVEGYNIDETSRKDRLASYEEAIKLASQIKENKSFPWPNASNIKFPLFTSACIAFNARMYPSLFPSDSIVTYEGGVDNPEVMDAAKRVAKYENFQLVHELPGWLLDMDKLTLTLPITANEFKKVYFDESTQTVRSELINIKNICINYNAPSIEKAQRITHLIELSKNEVHSYISKNLFLDISDKLRAPVPRNVPISDKVSKTTPAPADDTTPYIFLEQHCFWDLDNDGYAEPYIVTVEQESGQVARIVKRFDLNSIVYNQDNDLAEIVADEYFIQYTFIPSFDGSIYSIGWGDLLVPLNEGVNTTLNQLIDAGTLNNLPSGFLGKSLRVPGGDYSIAPGEWKFLNNTGQALKDNIVALPTKEPSPTLYNLVVLLLGSGKELSMTVESLMGQNPGQNQPLGTTMQVMQNGLKMLEGIYLRLRLALTKEISLIQKLNAKYLSDAIYKAFFSGPEAELASVSDFYNSKYVVPTAEKSISAKEIKRLRADFLMQVAGSGGFRLQEVKRNLLEAYEVPNIDRYLLKEEEIPPPPEEPSITVAKIKAQTDMQAVAVKEETNRLKLQLEQVNMQMTAQFESMKLEIAKYTAQIKEMKARIDGAAKMAKIELDQDALDKETRKESKKDDQ